STAYYVCRTSLNIHSCDSILRARNQHNNVDWKSVGRLCGTFGCVRHEGAHAAPIIHSALKRLEYRGYDSVGEVTVDNDQLTVKKDSGRLEEVHAKYNLDDLPGPVGVGHTR